VKVINNMVKYKGYDVRELRAADFEYKRMKRNEKNRKKTKKREKEYWGL